MSDTKRTASPRAGWKQHTVDLTAYKGTAVQFGLQSTGGGGTTVIDLDDVTVTTP